ncbi:MAG TPA: PRC-barrel domain-containing protein [Stellaceae bacterium]|nr:PRC-barrel domain-containing protein [Stellaceae bacterium]
MHHLMIDKFTGQVDYAVMSFGGFLGIGESYHPLPWKSLDYDLSLGGYVVDRPQPPGRRAALYDGRSAGLVGSCLYRPH